MTLRRAEFRRPRRDRGKKRPSLLGRTLAGKLTRGAIAAGAVGGGLVLLDKTGTLPITKKGRNTRLVKRRRAAIKKELESLPIQAYIHKPNSEKNPLVRTTMQSIGRYDVKRAVRSLREKNNYFSHPVNLGSVAEFRRPRRDRGRKRVRRAAMIGGGVLGAGALVGGGALLLRNRSKKGKIAASTPAATTTAPVIATTSSSQTGGAMVPLGTKARQGFSRGKSKARQVANDAARIAGEVSGQVSRTAKKTAAIVRSEGVPRARSALATMQNQAKRLQSQLPPRVATITAQGIERDRRARQELGRRVQQAGKYLRDTYLRGFSHYPTVVGMGRLAEFNQSRSGRRRQQRRLPQSQYSRSGRR